MVNRENLVNRPAVLMLRALGLGDFLTGVPAYRALRAAHPEHETVLAAPSALAPLARLCGAIDRLLPTGELAPIEWAGPPPDVGVDLHGNGPASHELVAATGARTLMVYASEAAPHEKGPWWDDDEHEVSRWCRLLEWWDIPADPRDLLLDPPDVPAPAEGAVVVHPGAAGGSRRWPADRYAAVARALTDMGERVVVTGSGRERPLAHEVAERAGLSADAVLAGRTGLAELAALVSRARLVVSNDTGMAHLGFAYARPSVTLYGPVSPALWGPPPGEPQHAVLWHGAGGRPGDAWGAVPDPRLLRITVEEVVDAARRVLPQPT
ncbi:glycosyltransferase family 9 protein [Thermomonospora cellulosilytica]|uniref:ADP-heptose:LPS heptosyltransferase n=1 Tax=Thermomonospora cellulosilytica TaxID=1411118 RepID=A0A7W3N261_9ACTN|nr:glycosyltransferase family 9 protein [Thermomonospora cellulosilytica]MBA9006108.1 ADP-heptose:LPS heptosyltransferase [Thermomonospora cellulosilytica]